MPAWPSRESRDALDPAPWPGRLRSPLPNGSAAPAPEVLGAGRGHSKIARLRDTWLLRGCFEPGVDDRAAVGEAIRRLLEYGDPA
jgi:hypothetical protein